MVLFVVHITPAPPQLVLLFRLFHLLLQQQFLYQAHDVPSAGHQGYLKTLTRLKQEGYILAWDG